MVLDDAIVARVVYQEHFGQEKIRQGVGEKTQRAKRLRVANLGLILGSRESPKLFQEKFLKQSQE